MKIKSLIRHGMRLTRNAAGRRRGGGAACALALLIAALPAPAQDAPAPFSETSRWIAPGIHAVTNYSSVLARREFSLDQKPRRAVLRVIGLGDYDPTCNGRRLAATGLNQPWSQYERTLYFREFDVTKLLRRGGNCLGLTLTHSFWHNGLPPKGRYYKDGPQRTAAEPLLLRAELAMEFPDGSRQQLGTDETWRMHAGPVTFSHIFAGEDFDARLVQPGWDEPRFHDDHWTPARLATAPAAELLPQTWPAIAAFAPHRPASVNEPVPGVWLFAFPQNCAAQLRVQLSGGKAGDHVTFRAGEHRNAQGRLFGHYLVDGAVVTDGSTFTHQWSSFYLGMQFVEVTGAVPRGRANPRGLPVVESLELVPVRAGLAEAGAFTSASTVFNGTHHLIDAAMQANAQHVMTDCPHREKLGWLEQAYLLAPSFLHRYDSAAWFGKILRDIRDAQEPSGRVLTVAPSYPAGKFPGAFNWTVEWGAAAALLPGELYRWTGDVRGLRENYELMRRFTDFIGTEATNGLAPGGLGDWYDYGHGRPPGPSRFTPVQLSATATWAMCARATADAAEVLGHAADARRYRALHARIAADFQRHFLDPATGRLRHLGSPQCANAMALCADIVPAELRPALVAEIIADLETRGWQQTPGDIGHVYFIRALAEAGRSDVLHRVYARDGKGSYGGILKKGLTAMPETWDAMMDGYQSLNHCMLGHVMEWFYGHVGGIRQSPGAVGWTNVLIAPEPGPLEHATVTVVTPRGKISSRWTQRAGRFRLTVDIPPGVSAVAVLPSGARQPLRAGRQTLGEARSYPLWELGAPGPAR